jgi:RHS repeat-associated protein
MFTGRRWDEVLALYDYRTRYYNPYLGRFLRIDTIGLWRDANNLGNPYAYVGNNPWSRLDPYGEGWWDDFWGWMGLQGGGDAINNRPAMAPPTPGSAPRRTMDDPSANIFLTGDPLAITSQQRFSAAASQTRETTIEMGQHVVAQNVVYLEGVAIAASAGPVIKAAEKTGIFGWIGRGVRRATSFWRKSSDDVVEYSGKVANVPTRIAPTRAPIEQPRDAAGRFAQKVGGELAPGSIAESATWDAIANKPGWTITRGRVYVRDTTGQVRVYDGYATSPSGRRIGIEVKSGTGRPTPEQRAFDTRLNSSRFNKATGVGVHKDVELDRSIEIRR